MDAERCLDRCRSDIPARLDRLPWSRFHWLGVIAGSAATVILLDPKIFSVDVGWRIGFGIGASFGFLVLFARRFIPESPRWLLIHGYAVRAERVVGEIEERVEREQNTKLLP